MVGERVALVDDRPEVTDRHYGEAVWDNRNIVLIDTGGSSLINHWKMEAISLCEAEVAVSEAVLQCSWLIDKLDSSRSHDCRNIAKVVGKQDLSRLVLCVNKCDGPR